MGVDRWRRRASVTSNLDNNTPLQAIPPPEPESTAPQPESTTPKAETTAPKKPRVLTKALRTFSNSSVDPTAAVLSRSSHSQHRLQKVPSGSNSMMERLHRRVSRESSAGSPVDGCPSPLLDSPYISCMHIIKSGSLRQDMSKSKTRPEYLVLTDQSLFKFSSFEAARVIFPQLNIPEGPAAIGRSASSTSISGKVRPAPEGLEIPLTAVLSIFEDVPASNQALDVWWSSPAPRLAYCRTQLPFTTTKDRDEWLAQLHRTRRQKMRHSPTSGSIPDNVRARIHYIVRSTETVNDDALNMPIFPVVRRPGTTPKPLADDTYNSADGGSLFYLAIGPFLCYFIEILRSDYATPPSALSTKAHAFGTVTLSRFQASIATHQETFAMSFRLPFGKESRLTLASVHYRRIIDTVIKTDRILRPSWPQHFQQVIFDVRGLSPPLQLTSGNDLGGFDISLPAYCAAFQVPVPNWRIDWNTPSQPCFCLLPPQENEEKYSALQLLAVFRALRYNGYFKAASFADVDLTPLAGRMDDIQYGDSIVSMSANRTKMPLDLYEIMAQASVLEREIHSLLFASDSFRSINLSNVLGLYDPKTQQRRILPGAFSLDKATSELVRPIVELLKRHLSHCHSILLSRNPMYAADAEDLRDTLRLRHVRLRRLELADCELPGPALSDIWAAVDAQAESLEMIDLSNNRGTARIETICNALSHLRRLTKLCIARNVPSATDLSFFDDDALAMWELQELDLSGIVLSDATVESLANYLSKSTSQSLRTLRLNDSRLNGPQAARLFRSMGVNRDMEVYMGSNRIDCGITDFCEEIGHGFGPCCLFLETTDFSDASYVKLLRALALNTSIKCLSLSGAWLPDAISETACQAIFDLLAKNTSIRYLDMSGFEAKLDDGRLGKGFPRALGGLRHNTHIEHLRVRCQMLNLNVGDLAEALAVNKTLRTLDCEANDLTLSNLRFLTSKLEGNLSLRTFSPFSSQELNEKIEKSVSDATLPAAPPKRSPMMSRFKQEKINETQQDTDLGQELRGEWEQAVLRLQSITDRNLGNHFEVMVSDAALSMQCKQSSANSDSNLAAAFGGLALRDFDGLKALTARHSAEVSQQVSLHGRSNSGRSTVERPGSLDSSEAAGSPISDAGSTESGATSTGAATPTDVVYGMEMDAGISKQQEQWTVYSDSADQDDLYGDGQDVEVGLQMKRHRKYQGDPTNRIEEEDHAL